MGAGGAGGKYFPFGGGGGGDVESGLLYPGQDSLDAALRWGFVKKVYGIIAAQLVLTTIVAAVVVANADVRHFMVTHWGVQIALLVVSMLGLIPLYIWRQSHPHNLLLLGVWTCLFSGGCAVCSRKRQAALQSISCCTELTCGRHLFLPWPEVVSWLGP
jgi:hypothetical protein